MTQATKRRGESIDSLLLRFEKVSKRAGIIRDVRKHEAHMSKGERDRVKHREAQRKSARG